MKIITISQSVNKILPLIFLSCASFAQVGIGTTTPTAQLTVMEDGIFNESGGANDFRVEGDTNANLLFVSGSQDAIGFSAPPTAPFSLGIPVHTISYPIEIGNDGNTGIQALLGYFRVADVTIEPETGGFGYVGYRVGPIQQEWYRMYANGFFTVSARDSKKNIVTVKSINSLENYFISTIKNLKPSLYNYKNEYDQMLTGSENHYRPAYRLGLIADESPDYILDEGFSGVDAYGLATLNLIGIQHNINEIEKLKNASRVVQDFGSAKLNTQELWIYFNEDFNDQIPVVTLTSNNSSVILSVSEKTSKGFRVIASEANNDLSLDWIAIAKINNQNTSQNNSIESSLMNKLEVPVQTKNQIIKYYDSNITAVKSKQ